MMKRLGGLLLAATLLTGCSSTIESQLETTLKEKAIEFATYAIQENYQPIIDAGNLTFRYSIDAETMLAQENTIPDVYGEFVSIDYVTVANYNGIYEVSVFTNYEHYKRVFLIAFDTNLKIAGIYVR